MKSIVVVSAEDVREMNVDGYQPHLVIPLPTPPTFARDDVPLTADYPHVLLDRHIVMNARGERFTAYWPTSWSQEWALTAIHNHHGRTA